MADFYAYTVRLPDNHRQSIIFDIYVSAAVIGAIPKKVRKGLTVKALVDTGAAMSGISRKAAQSLQLQAVEKKRVFTAQGRFIASTYLLDITFPFMPTIPTVQVMDFPEGYGFDFVIGMDILRKGDSTISNAHNQTVFSFRIPSNTVHTDYNTETAR